MLTGSEPVAGAARDDGRAWLRVDAAIVAALAVAPVVVETFAGYVRAGWDLGWFFQPLWRWWWQRPRFLGGWNPWLFGGFPSGSDPQLAVLHPFTALHAILPDVVASGVEGALVPAIAGVGMLLYLARIGCGRAGRLIGALSFALGGYLTAHAPHPGIERAAMMLPWGLLAIEALAGRTLVAGLGAVVGAILLGGHPQLSALAVLLLLLYAAWLGRPGERRRWLQLGAAFALGALIGAAVWLPALQLLRATTRAIAGPVFPDPRFALADLPRLLMPFAGGGGIGPFASVVRNPLGCGLVECGSYPGLLVWLVLLVGAVRLVRSPQGRFWLAVAAFALVAATGALPLPTGVRGAARILLWWNVALAACAALAVAGLAAERPRTLAWVAAWVTLAALVVILDFVVVERGAVLAAALALVIAAVALLAIARGLPAEIGLTAALAIDLLLYATTLAPAALRPAELLRQRAATALVRGILDDPDCHVPENVRVLLLTPFQGFDWAPLDGVATVQGYNPLVPQPVASLLGQTGMGLEAVGHVADISLATARSRALDVLRVGLVVRERARPSPLGDAIASATRAGDPRWEELPACERDGYAVSVNHRTLPLAWLVGEAVPATPQAAIARVRGEEGDFVPERQVLLEGGGSARAADPPPSLGDVRVEAYRDDELSLTFTASRDGWLVTSEAAAPGWRVEVDGMPAELLTANGGFRAVRVAAGTHAARFVYRSTVAIAGLVLSLLGTLLAFALWLSARRQSHGPS